MDCSVEESDLNFSSTSICVIICSVTDALLRDINSEISSCAVSPDTDPASDANVLRASYRPSSGETPDCSSAETMSDERASAEDMSALRDSSSALKELPMISLSPTMNDTPRALVLSNFWNASAISTREMIDAVHASGHTFHVWTLDDLPTALEAFRLGAEKALEEAKKELPDVIILQPRSPSCGVHEIYDGSFSGTLVPGKGVFAEKAMEAGFRVTDPDTFLKQPDYQG